MSLREVDRFKVIQATAEGLLAQALGLIRDTYADFGPTLACEKLRERHGIVLAKETVRRLMIDAGFWVPRRLCPPKVHQPRNRRACLGELIQIDGSDHAWFEDRSSPCTLLGEPPRPHNPPLHVKRQRLINRLDLERAIKGTPMP